MPEMWLAWNRMVLVSLTAPGLDRKPACARLALCIFRRQPKPLAILSSAPPRSSVSGRCEPEARHAPCPLPRWPRPGVLRGINRLAHS